MLFTQKIQLNLTEEQEKLLGSQSKICNWLYNKFMEIEQTAYNWHHLTEALHT